MKDKKGKGEKKLIEVLIKENNYSEKEACGLIMAGKVLVNENIITSPNYRVKNDDEIKIKTKKKYVSRGSYKLLTFFKNFNIDVKNKIVIDIGSSTGGFTQVLLEKGAKRIYAVDCGKNQLDYSLRINPKVISIENRVIQSITKKDLGYDNIDLAVMDLSFRSSLPIIHYVFYDLEIKELIVLIKPQFEFNKYKEILSLSNDFKGIVTFEDSNKIIEKIKEEITTMNLKIVNIIEAEIKGIKGNSEYLFYIVK